MAQPALVEACAFGALVRRHLGPTGGLAIPMDELKVPATELRRQGDLAWAALL